MAPNVCQELPEIPSQEGEPAKAHHVDALSKNLLHITPSKWSRHQDRAEADEASIRTDHTPPLCSSRLSTLQESPQRSHEEDLTFLVHSALFDASSHICFNIKSQIRIAVSIFGQFWPLLWTREDSNPRPPQCKTGSGKAPCPKHATYGFTTIWRSQLIHQLNTMSNSEYHYESIDQIQLD